MNQKFQELLAEIQPVDVNYAREDEAGLLNPAFENISEGFHCPLNFGDKRIWALRSDGILATGIKRSYSPTYFNSAFSVSSDYLNKLDHRFGHPSLTIPSGNYDGKVLVAGWLFQKQGYIVCINWSGRYCRQDLGESTQAKLRNYLNDTFLHAYGQQPIVYIEGDCEDTDLLRLIMNKPDGLEYYEKSQHPILNNAKKVLENDALEFDLSKK